MRKYRLHRIHILIYAAFVVCDLSYHNPDAFYELALRHATKKPTIHIIRKCYKIPFDINDFKTIVIDDSDAIDSHILSYLKRNKRKHL